jgi:hypothetical protein
MLATVGARRGARPLHKIVYDAMRFFLSNSSIIEEARLQLYCSALVFSRRRVSPGNIIQVLFRIGLFSNPRFLAAETRTYEPCVIVRLSPPWRSLLMTG